MWPTIKLAEYIHHFVTDNYNTLLDITKSYNGKFDANLYFFDMNQMEFFLHESRSLEKAAHGNGTFVCFPRQNYVIFYHMAQEF